MFEILQKIGSIFSMIGTFFVTIWDTIKGVFSWIGSTFSACIQLITSFPLWLASILVFAALTSVILWVVYHDG